MAQNKVHLNLFLCLMLLSYHQGQAAEEDLPLVEKDLPSPKISCPEGANAYDSYCYIFVKERLTWVKADLFCKIMISGNLVSILSQAENNFVASLVKESGTSDTNVWTGLHDPENNRRWHWSSGALFLFKSWATGAPSSANRGYCVSLTSNTAYKKWKDENCESQYSFVCKFKS
ncbi:lithostathine-2-like [Rattus rattus]|uniref:lithostathine-2-like n=1 Tax=Rattus rattus TaxID=10117 RepID=UPI0013F30A9E|nr:lithostathine-2-like [Rattus rattus]